MRRTIVTLLMFSHASVACAQADPKENARAPQAAVSDEDIFEAAAFTLTGKAWGKCGDPGTLSYSAGEIAQRGDFNGDGLIDAVVLEGGTYCFGGTGSGYTLVSNKADGLGIFMSVSGIPRFPRYPGGRRLAGYRSRRAGILVFRSCAGRAANTRYTAINTKENPVGRNQLTGASHDRPGTWTRRRAKSRHALHSTWRNASSLLVFVPAVPISYTSMAVCLWRPRLRDRGLPSCSKGAVRCLTPSPTWTRPNPSSRRSAGGSVPPEQLAASLGIVRHVTETYSVGGFKYTSSHRRRRPGAPHDKAGA